MPPSATLVITGHLAILVIIASYYPFSSPPAPPTTCPLSGVYASCSFVRLFPSTDAQIRLMRQLASDVCNYHQIAPGKPTLHVRNALIISRESLKSLSTVVPPSDLEIRTFNLSDEFALHTPRQELFIFENEPSNAFPRQFFNQYSTLQSIQDAYTHLATVHPHNVQVINYGSSLLGRPLQALRVSLSHGFLQETQKKQTIVITALQHAREWATTVSAIYAALHYASPGNSRGSPVKSMHDIELMIVPVTNPDGYVSTRYADRLWRKNLRGATNDTFPLLCHGVDLNRNWPSSSSFSSPQSVTPPSPCSNSYPGSHPLSEPETSNLYDLLLRQHANAPILAHLDLHSYGAYVHPLWHETVGSEGVNSHDSAAKRISDALGKPYSFMREREGGSKYTGFFTDWTATQFETVASITLQLAPIRDTDFIHGFIPDTAKLAQLCRDVVIAIDTLLTCLPGHAVDRVAGGSEATSKRLVGAGHITTRSAAEYGNGSGLSKVWWFLMMICIAALSILLLRYRHMIPYLGTMRKCLRAASCTIIKGNWYRCRSRKTVINEGTSLVASL